MFSDFVGFILSYHGLCGFLIPLLASGQLLQTGWSWKFDFNHKSLGCGILEQNSSFSSAKVT